MSVLKYKDENNQWQRIVPEVTPTTVHTDEEKYTLIVSLMNKKSQVLGMTNTTWNNPYGGSLFSTYNVTTARDMLRMGIMMAGYPRLMQYLSWRGTRQIPVYGPNARTYTLTENHQTMYETWYKTLHNDQTKVFPYKVLAVKLGGWSGNSPTGTRVFCGVAQAYVEGKYVTCVISRVSGNSGSYTGRNCREMAMCELLDVCAATIRNSRLEPGETPETVPTVTYAEYACAAYTPTPFPETWSQWTPDYIYEKSADTQFNPASTTKVMSGMIFFDSGIDCLQFHEMSETDCTPDSGTNFGEQPGDILCNDDAMYLDLILSNGPNVLGLCRYVADRVYKSADELGITIQL